MRNEAIFLEFSLKYDDGAPLKLRPGAKCPPLLPPLGTPADRTLRPNIQLLYNVAVTTNALL